MYLRKFAKLTIAFLGGVLRNVEGEAGLREGGRVVVGVEAREQRAALDGSGQRLQLVLAHIEPKLELLGAAILVLF